MSALPPRLAIPIVVPLALILAACGNGETKAKPTVQPTAVITECTDAQLEEIYLCAGEDAGSVCTPAQGTIVEWAGPSTTPPELTWTSPCHPHGYEVVLQTAPASGQGFPSFLASAEITAHDPELGGPERSWSPDAHLPWSGARYRYLLRPMQSGEAENEPHDYSEIVFWTGPLCMGTPPPNPPSLSFPQDGAAYTVLDQFTSGYPIFRWFSVPHPACLMKYQGQVATDEAFTTDLVPILGRYGSPMDTDGMVKRHLQWCHEYYWRVRAVTDNGQGPWSQTRSFSLMPEGGEDQCAEEGIPVRTPGAGYEVIVTKNAACRTGPGTNFGIAAYATAGEKHPVDGRNADGTWFRLADLRCYVAGSLLQDRPDVPVLPDPPTPTLPAIKCQPSMGQGECAAAGGTWVCATKCVGFKCTESCTCDCP